MRNAGRTACRRVGDRASLGAAISEKIGWNVQWIVGPIVTGIARQSAKTSRWSAFQEASKRQKLLRSWRCIHVNDLPKKERNAAETVLIHWGDLPC